MGEQETGRTAVPQVGIPVRRPLRYKRWEIKGEWLHPQSDPQPSHGTATKSGRSRADQLVRKYLSRTRCWMVQTAEHAELRRGSGSRDYDYHKALGAVLPTTPRTPCNSSTRSTCGYWALGLQLPAVPAAPCFTLPTTPKMHCLVSVCACARARDVGRVLVAVVVICYHAGRLKGEMAVFG